MAALHSCLLNLSLILVSHVTETIFIIHFQLLLNSCETLCWEFEWVQAKSEHNMLRLMLNYYPTLPYAEGLAVRVTAEAYLMGIILQ